LVQALADVPAMVGLGWLVGAELVSVGCCWVGVCGVAGCGGVDVGLSGVAEGVLGTVGVAVEGLTCAVGLGEASTSVAVAPPDADALDIPPVQPLTKTAKTITTSTPTHELIFILPPARPVLFVDD